MSAVRRSCQTIPRRGAFRVFLSQIKIVSRWLVIPSAVRFEAPTVSTTVFTAVSVACHISSASCSTQPGDGKCCGNSQYPREMISPISVTAIAVTPVVPASIASMAIGTPNLLSRNSKFS